MTDYDALIKAMQEFNAPQAREQRLKDKWSKANEICAIHVQYPLNDPAPDGSFEILFVTETEADKMLQRGSSLGRLDKISFEMGVALAQTEDCCGGSHALEDAKAALKYNPVFEEKYSALEI